MGGYNHCLKVDATIMVSKKWPMIGTHIVIIFMTQHITIASDNSLKHP